MYPYLDLFEIVPAARLQEMRDHSEGELAGELPTIYLARHGETTWSQSGRLTGRTDLPLTERGERAAIQLGRRLRGIEFARVFTSPLQRALRTCELAGYRAVAEVDPELVEWDYGDLEGLREEDIRRTRPGWQLFVDGCPGGESPALAMARAERVVTRLRTIGDNVLLFTSGHFIRVLACCWLGLGPADNARLFALSTASLSILGYEGDLAQPAVRLWNETEHLAVAA
jgi:probable phosphoglycerate mutase